ncbi:MAG TPA: type II secretion system protein [Verrucomicrobiae bacterium]|nr:type II secretion system protein [Verrucomicrobiae bacterium]
MNIKTQNGFTIVELMLFLGISGLLLVMLLAGTTVTIQRQRYSDSVNSAQSFFQRQYGEALNVINARSGKEACSASNFIVPADDGSGEARGTSDCLVLGKAIDIPRGNTLTSYTVVGRAPAAEDTSLAEDELLQQYNPTLVREIEAEAFDIPWGASVVNARKDAGEQINRLLLLRSPRSGALYTYAYQSSSGGAAAKDGVTRANRRATVNVCIRSADIASSTSIVSIAMGGGPEAVQARFDVPAGEGKC